MTSSYRLESVMASVQKNIPSEKSSPSDSCVRDAYARVMRLEIIIKTVKNISYLVKGYIYEIILIFRNTTPC